MAETTPTPPGADVDPIDQMADILVGDAETETEAPAADPGADPEDTPEGAADESPADEDAEVEDAEVDDQDDAETVSDDDDPEDDDRSLRQLLGLGGNQVSVDEETGALSLTVKVDGKVSSVGLKDIITGYQTDKHNTHKSQALAADRKVFEEKVGEKAYEIKRQLEQNAALTQTLINEMTQEFQSTNWDELRQTDPAEYAARQQDQSVRYNQLQQIQQQVQQQHAHFDQERQQKGDQERGDLLAQQRDVMISNNPTWQDQTVMKADIGAMRTFLTEDYGLSDADISMIGDAKAIAIIQDAMAFRKGASVAKKKLAAVPKMQKSKGAKRRRVSKLDKLTKAAKVASGAQKRDLQTEAIAELLSGG